MFVCDVYRSSSDFGAAFGLVVLQGHLIFALRKEKNTRSIENMGN